MIILAPLPGGQYAAASAVNDEGMVVGVSDDASGIQHAVAWIDRVATSLGTLGSDSFATDVNRHGVVVGCSEIPPRMYGHFHPFVWSNGQITDLGTLGGTSAWAEAINDAGEVVGFSQTAGGPHRAFRWKDGQMTALATERPNQATHAYDIDNHGRIVGEAGALGGDTVPVIWDGGTPRQVGDRYGRATAINDSGQIAGCLSTGSESFSWTESEGLTVIGPLEGTMYLIAVDIDRRGRIIARTDHRAFIWDRGSIEWLPGPVRRRTGAAAVSDDGSYVVGDVATTERGAEAHAMLWSDAHQI
jgi:probable HAF family extracellular repeat protein